LKAAQEPTDTLDAWPNIWSFAMGCKVKSFFFFHVHFGESEHPSTVISIVEVSSLQSSLVDDLNYLEDIENPEENAVEESDTERHAFQTTIANNHSQDLLKEIEGSRRVILWDLETTGLSPKAKIIEISCLDLKSNQWFHSFVKPPPNTQMEPHVPHPWVISDLSDAPTLKEVIEQLTSWLAGLKGKISSLHTMETDLTSHALLLSAIATK